MLYIKDHSIFNNEQFLKQAVLTPLDPQTLCAQGIWPHGSQAHVFVCFLLPSEPGCLLHRLKKQEFLKCGSVT